MFYRYVENVIHRIARKWGFPLVIEEQQASTESEATA